MAWQTVVIIALLCAMPLSAAGGWYMKSCVAPAPIVATTYVPPAVGDMPPVQAAKPQPRRRDEGYTGGQFLVLKDFKVSGLACYWAGHEYATTKLNAVHVRDAVELGNAVITAEPKR